MTLTLNAILAMVWRSITNPREGAEEVLSLGVPAAAIGPFLLLTVVLSAILGQLSTFLVIGTMEVAGAGLLAMPVVTGVLQLLVLVASILAIHYIGRGFGGTGSMTETALLMGWLQFIMVCVQAVQLLLAILAPPFANIVGIAALVLFMWLLTNFVAVLHSFRSLGQVFVMILVSLFTIAFALSVLLSILGFVPSGGTL